jgi:hypothetical protein
MPKKKTPPSTESIPEPADAATLQPTPEPVDHKLDTPSPLDRQPDSEKPPESTTIEIPQKKPISPWQIITGSIILGIMLGFLLSYWLIIKPMQDQLTVTSDLNSNSQISSNQFKSDLSNTRLRQQEMEIRYLTAAARLESANQYILLLRMKEQVSAAQLFVVEKRGLEARKALAEIDTLYNQLHPYITQKDAAAAKELYSIIKTSIQDLTSDPESASTDLTNIASQLEKVEATLFQME